jgi:hypothetical protein
MSHDPFVNQVLVILLIWALVACSALFGFIHACFSLRRPKTPQKPQRYSLRG